MFKELDITLWKLRYPVILSDVMSVQLLMNLRLLLISDHVISLNDLLINDVLRAMCIDVQEEVCALSISNIDTLIVPMEFSCHCWWLGIEVLRDFHGICLYTPCLSELKRNAAAKCDLWHQIHRVMYLLLK